MGSDMFEKIIDMISNSKRIGIFTHINPDGDALGSVYSLRDVLRGMGKMTEEYFCGSIDRSRTLLKYSVRKYPKYRRQSAIY